MLAADDGLEAMILDIFCEVLLAGFVTIRIDGLGDNSGILHNFPGDLVVPEADFMFGQRRQIIGCGL
jgi:hypothetical protein